MSGLASSLYNTLLKRNTTFLTTVFVSAFAVQMAFDTGSERVWDSINKGRQWKDIKHQYVAAEEEE